MSRLSKIYLTKNINQPIENEIVQDENERSILYQSNNFVIYNGSDIDFRSMESNNMSKAILNQYDKNKTSISKGFVDFKKKADNLRFNELKGNENTFLRFDNKKFYEWSGFKRGNNANPIEQIEKLIKQGQNNISVVVNLRIGLTNGISDGQTRYAPFKRNSTKNVIECVFNVTIGRRENIPIILANEFGDVWFAILIFFPQSPFLVQTFRDIYEYDFKIQSKMESEGFSQDLYLKMVSTHFSFLIERFYEDIK